MRKTLKLKNVGYLHVLVSTYWLLGFIPVWQTRTAI